MLVVHCERNCERARTVVGAVELLLATLPTLPKASAVRNCALALVQIACLNNADDLNGAMVAGAPALVAALRFTSHTAQAFESVVVAVHDLLLRYEACLAAPLYAAGVLEATIPGLRLFPTNAPLQKTAFQLMFLLFRDAKLDADQQASVRNSGAVDVVVAAMRTHHADAMLQRAGCDALCAVRHLIDAPEGWLEQSGYLDVVLTAMRTHGTSREVQISACNALWSAMSRASAADRDQAVAAGGLAALLAAWRTHAADATVVNACSAALNNMLVGNAPQIAAAVAAGVPELALKALRTHPAAHLLQNGAYNLLVTLLKSGRSVLDLELGRHLLTAGALQLATRPGALQSEGRERFVACLQDVVDDAERAAAELLAEEEAPAAASKKKSRSKKKGGAAAAAAADAGDSGTSAVPEPAASAAEGEAADTAAPVAPAAAAAASSEPSAGAARRRRRAATKAARRAGGGPPAAAVAAEAAADCDSDEVSKPDAAGAAPEDAAAAATPVSAEAADAADAADAAASGAQLLGDIFPWLHIAPVPAAIAAPVLPPLPLAAQPPLLQQQAVPGPTVAAKAAEVVRLRAEVEANKCPICLDAAKSTVLLPCRHLALCGAPACAAMLGAPPLCPLCREPVADTMQLFV